MDSLFENWEETKEALLEGLDDRMAGIVAPVLENQKNHVLAETAAAGAIVAHDVAGFRKILIPMIRRIIPGTIATELVGVQPMQGPVGLVYSLRYKYLEAATHTVANSPFGGFDVAADDELFGNLVPIRAFYSGDTGAAQAAGASGIAGAASTEVDITAATATGVAWPSSLDSSTAGMTDGLAIDGVTPIGGITRGGSGSFLEGSGGRKIGLEVVSQAVEAGSRKLQAGWTIEAMQDLNAQHGLDVESEMTQAMSAEIVQEIDAEIITDLLAIAGTVDTWDGTTVSAGLTPNYVGDRFANLAVLINRVANEIGRKTRRGVGNFMVVSPMIVSVLQSAAKSVFAPSTEGSFKGPNNTAMVGTLNGQLKVYSYLWNQAQPGADAYPGLTPTQDQILIGYKGGNGETDTGYFYCPYIPLMSSGVVVNPLTFQPVVSLMTRYGKTAFTDPNVSLGNSADYYGKIGVDTLSFL
ncbi:hypothetical protein LCGC14_0838840 [marine sediment metagenome]|uniref:Major capsid protein n=1 Tax=marine sediment metagenome TaxID=412755 RepID=A0A0F9PDS7_9ZZZZ